MDSNYEILESLIAWIAGDESGGGDVERYLASPRVAALARVLDVAGPAPAKRQALAGTSRSSCGAGRRRSSRGPLGRALSGELRLDEEACLELFAKVTDRARRRELAERLGLARGGALDDDALSGSAWAQPAERAAVARALPRPSPRPASSLFEVQILDTEAARLFEAARDLSAALDDAGRKAGTPSLHPHAAKLRRCRDVLLLAAVQALDGSARFRDRGAAAPSSSTALFLYGDAADGEEPTEPNALRADTGAAQRFVDAWPAPEGLEGRGARGVAALAVALLKRPRSWDAADPASEQELRRRLGDALDAGVCRFLVRTHGLLRGALRDGGGGREPVVYLVALGELANAFVEALLDVDALPGPRGDVEGVPDGLEDVLALRWATSRRVGDCARRDDLGRVPYLTLLGAVARGSHETADAVRDFLRAGDQPENEFAAVAPSGVFDGSAPPPGYSLKNFLALVDRYGEMLRANELERSGATPPPPGAMQNLYRPFDAPREPLWLSAADADALVAVADVLANCARPSPAHVERLCDACASSRPRAPPAPGARSAAGASQPARSTPGPAARRVLRRGEGVADRDLRGAETRLRTYGATGAVLALLAAVEPHLGAARVAAVKFAARDVLLRCAVCAEAAPLAFRFDDERWRLATRALALCSAVLGRYAPGSADWADDFDGASRSPSPSGGFAVLYDALGPACGLLRAVAGLAARARRGRRGRRSRGDRRRRRRSVPRRRRAAALGAVQPGGRRADVDDRSKLRHADVRATAPRELPKAFEAMQTSPGPDGLPHPSFALATAGEKPGGLRGFRDDDLASVRYFGCEPQGLLSELAARVAPRGARHAEATSCRAVFLLSHVAATSTDGAEIDRRFGTSRRNFEMLELGHIGLLAAPETRDLAGWLLNGGALSAVVDLALACTAPLDKGPRLAARACETGERALGLLFVLAKRRASRSAVVDAVTAGDDGRALTTLARARGRRGRRVPAASARLARALDVVAVCAHASKLPEGVAERSRGRCRGAVDAYFGAAPSILGAPFRVAAPEPARLDDVFDRDPSLRKLALAHAAKPTSRLYAVLDVVDAAGLDAAARKALPADVADRLGAWAAHANDAAAAERAALDLADAAQRLGVVAAGFAYEAAVVETTRDADLGPVPYLTAGGDPFGDAAPAGLGASAASSRSSRRRRDGGRDAALDASTLETAAAALLRLGAARQDVALRLVDGGVVEALARCGAFRVAAGATATRHR
ncbi:hypothetical protein JL721_2810 [Aureococcus anophagefferens]|nr:hypothetical protein JL721_2810 [Aureococcus anophagefferens]